MNAADALCAARRRHRLTQRRLAFRSGVPQSTIARIEAGHVEPSLSTLNSVLYGLGEVAGISVTPLQTTSTAAAARTQLTRSPTERLERMVAFARFAADVRAAGARAT